MRKLRSDLVTLLATEFAGDNPKQGFSFDEIINFFKDYDSSISKEDYKQIRPKRQEFFASCLNSLPPLQQIIVILDLLNHPPPTSKYPMPGEDKITEIKKRLFSVINLTPISDEMAILNFEIGFTQLINDWYRIVSRIRESPGASITASRTTIENLYIYILRNFSISQNEIDEAKGDLGRLHKAVCKVLGIDEWTRKIVSGLSSIIYGIAEVSNIAGDRHGGDYDFATLEKQSL